LKNIVDAPAKCNYIPLQFQQIFHTGTDLMQEPIEIALAEQIEIPLSQLTLSRTRVAGAMHLGRLDRILRLHQGKARHG
jgi:hypothetical protein